MTRKLHNRDKRTDTDIAREKKKILTNVKQSNHDQYTLPPCMVPWANEPLYLVIARWAMKQKRWVNRNDIVAIFQIPDRRASFQLSYISRRKERVACRTRYVPAGGGRRQRMEIYIDRILPAAEEKTVPAPVRSRTEPTKKTGPTSRGVGSGMGHTTGLWERLLKGCREGSDHE
ncbi:TPA: CaiF/GrlA family transcriptional regulator [Escherichia coli]